MIQKIQGGFSFKGSLDSDYSSRMALKHVLNSQTYDGIDYSLYRFKTLSKDDDVKLCGVVEPERFRSKGRETHFYIEDSRNNKLAHMKILNKAQPGEIVRAFYGLVKQYRQSRDIKCENEQTSDEMALSLINKYA